MNTTDRNDIKREVNQKIDKGADLYKEGKQKTNELYQEGKNKLEQGKENAQNAFEQVKETASELFEEGRQKIGHAQANVQEYSDELIETIKGKPITSVLVAGGIGYLLSLLLRK